MIFQKNNENKNLFNSDKENNNINKKVKRKPLKRNINQNFNKIKQNKKLLTSLNNNSNLFSKKISWNNIFYNKIKKINIDINNELKYKSFCNREKDENLNLNHLKNKFSFINNNSKIKFKFKNLNNFIFFRDIFLYLKKKESNQEKIKCNIFLKNESEINNKMRLILFDWIEEISNKFNLKIKTTNICFEIIDFYICNNLVIKINFQLLGIVSLFIATKFEEIYPPSLNKMLKICNNFYSKKSFLKLELSILKYFDFNINRVYRVDFYYLFSKWINLESKCLNFGLMLLEITFIKQEFYKYYPSILSFSLIYLINKLFNLSNNLIKLKNYNGVNFLIGSINLNDNKIDFKFNENEIKKCASEIFEIYNIWTKNKILYNIKSKFLKKEFDNISEFKIANL